MNENTSTTANTTPYTTANPTDLPYNPTALIVITHYKQYRKKIEAFIRSLQAVKTINEHWTKFFIRAYWQRAMNDPDLIVMAPCMIVMGFLLPWVFRLLAVIIMPLMVGLGSLLFVVAVVQKVKQMFLGGK